MPISRTDVAFLAHTTRVAHSLNTLLRGVLSQSGALHLGYPKWSIPWKAAQLIRVRKAYADARPGVRPILSDMRRQEMKD